MPKRFYMFIAILFILIALVSHSHTRKDNQVQASSGQVYFKDLPIEEVHDKGI